MKVAELRSPWRATLLSDRLEGERINPFVEFLASYGAGRWARAKHHLPGRRYRSATPPFAR
jgi:hypothetical protein